MAKLSEHIWEIDHDVVVDDFPIDNFPEIHVPNSDSAPRRWNSHERSTMYCGLRPKGGRPFTHVKTALVGAYFIAECRLERLLPIRLKLVQSVFYPTTGVTQPTEISGKKFVDIGNAMIIQSIDHLLNNAFGFIRFGQIGVSRFGRLRWPRPFQVQFLVS